MKYFFTGKVKAVLIIAVLLTAGLAVLYSLTGVSPGDVVVKGILAPLRAGTSSLTAQAEQIYNYIFEYESLAAENEALRQELAELKDDAQDSLAAQKENERLRELLKLKEAHPDYELVDSYIISWSSNDWTRTFTLNRGSGSGIETGMCVITQSGEVVGLVSEVGANYSVVKSILDSSLEIRGTIASSGFSGMVQGAYTAEQDGLLRMDYLPSAAVIRNKDQVVTSGSTVYPRNLILGYVVDAGYDDIGVSMYALLKPAADIDTLEQVFVITEFSVE